MARQTVTWVCPAMCGCRISMSAEWPNPITNGESFTHPLGAGLDGSNAITDLSIVAVCPTHTSLLTDPLRIDPYYGSPGYLRPLPASPTPAERLYIALYRFSGQRVSLDTCGCSIYQVIDRSGAVAPASQRHPTHTHRCDHHTADVEGLHTDALEQNSRKNLLLQQVSVVLGIDVARVTWRYDTLAGARVFYVNLSRAGVTLARRALVQAWADTALGARRVVVE